MFKRLILLMLCVSFIGLLFINFPKKTHLTSFPTVIQANDYQQFWVWGVPKNRQVIKNSQILYILQGEIRAKRYTQQQEKAKLTQQGVGILTVPDKQVWLVYRATDDDWHEDVMFAILQRLRQWQTAGNQVVGIQIDFDSATYQLDKYLILLQKVRKQLPGNYQLSVTGLLDWANQAENPVMIQLGKTVDELVMQTYQGTTTIPNYLDYLKKLQNLPFKFKVGLVEQGQWQGADFLTNNPNFAGYVVFLRSK